MDYNEFNNPDLLHEFIDELEQDHGITFYIYQIKRKFEVHIAYWMQGRRPLNVVNEYRKLAYLDPIKESQNDVITWTWVSDHMKGDAFDGCILKDKKAIWDLKADTNSNNIDDYKEVALLAKKKGLVTWLDYPKEDKMHWDRTHYSLPKKENNVDKPVTLDNVKTITITIGK
jgi:hypothetical protein